MRRRPVPSEHDPLVFDRYGRVIGVRTPPPRPPEETAASRHWLRRRNLVSTGELHAQADLRNHVTSFHIDPWLSSRH